MVANWLVRLSRLSKVVGSNYILPTALQLGHERELFVFNSSENRFESVRSSQNKKF